MIAQNDILAALATVHEVMPPTPQWRWPLLCKQLSADVWVKHENHGPIGSFKLRGALTYFEALAATGSSLTILAATRGNHGQAVAYAAARHGMRAIIIVPFGNDPAKNTAMQAWGAEIVEHGTIYQEAREHGDALARTHGHHVVKSFTPAWLKGTGTAAWELLTARPHLRTLYVPIGMGSGISAAILVKRMLSHPVEIVGVVAAGAPAYALSFSQRRPVSTDGTDTIADGLSASSPNPDAVDLIVEGAARVVQVTDAQIVSAMRLCLETTHNLAEPSAAAAFAAAVNEQHLNTGKEIAIMLTGGNVSMPLLRFCLNPPATS